MVKAGCSNASFRPQFIAELQPADLEKLKIPSEFMMHIEDEEKSRLVASVLSPLGKPWIIKLIKDQSDNFFKGGWPEFFKFHKLEAGFKLVFRYEGNMVFTVKVFGLNGCRMNYHQDAPAILRITGLDDSREETPGKCAGVMKAAVPSSSGKHAKRKHDQVTEKEIPCHEGSNIQDELGTPPKSNAKKKVNRNVISTTHLTHETKMSHYNIYNFLPLPKKFGSVPPCNLERGEVTVKNEKQESWKIQFNTVSAYNNLCRGWKEFCWKTGIETGDKCTLKIIAKNEILVCVTKADKAVETIDVKSSV